MATGLSKREATRQNEARHASECALEAWLSFLGHRWNALILWRLSTGPESFSELAAGLSGITPKVLTDRLTELAEKNLVTRSQGPGFPRRTVYEVTMQGNELSEQLQHFHRWATENPLPAD